MNVLVPIKQVIDPDHSSRLRLGPRGTSIDSSGLERKANPFDEYALEAALRLTEDGRHPGKRLGSILAMTIGDPDTERVLRSALALGADAARRVNAREEDIDAAIVSKIVVRLQRESASDLVILGKQSVDGDGNEVAQRVAALLDWPQITCASGIEESSDGTLIVQREVDGGRLRLSVRTPVVISVDLRIVAPGAVRSRHTPREHAYPDGVRYASLPAIIAAKRKSIPTQDLHELIATHAPLLRYAEYELPQRRERCKLVGSAEELLSATMDKLRS